MINPDEIRQQALKWWEPLLQSHVNNEPFFPKSIDRIGKVQPVHVTQRFEALQDEIEALYKNAKNEIGTGYLVRTAAQHFRRTGAHELPDSIVFETAEDYLHYTGKQREWKLFVRNSALLEEGLPSLKGWIAENLLSLTLPDTDWVDIVTVCKYFIVNPRPHLYVRQLPIRLHTKFIEDHAPLLQSLLDYLIPDHIRNKGQKKFAERYFLKCDEPLIRIRLLDKKLAIYNNIMDLSISLTDFERTNWDCGRVVITENKMNFLTLPALPSAIAIWSGGGFMVSYLRNAAWLKSKSIHYWGDIDEHGFQILHQIRSYYGQTQSVMMDKETFNAFHEFAVNGKRNKAEELGYLSNEEAGLYSYIKGMDAKNRLEQEKIPQYYVDVELNSAISILV
jgi:hypothetical protein